MEGVAFIAFVYAAILAFSRYKHTKEITNLWLLIAIAIFFFSLASLIDVFEKSASDIVYTAMENVEVTLILIGSTLFFSAVCLYGKEKELVKSGLGKKSRERERERDGYKKTGI